MDDNACNLASINLLKFKKADGTFDVARYRAAVRILITAQEILVDNASYPTPAIAENAHIFRTLGLGYANIGALLMSMGLGYDSDEGRALAANLTAIMTGEAYVQSAYIAEVAGAFPGYKDSRAVGFENPPLPDNEGSMFDVITLHRQAVSEIEAFPQFEYLRTTAKTVWEKATELGVRFGYRNAQCTGATCISGDALVTTSRGLIRFTSIGAPAGERQQQMNLAVATDRAEIRAREFLRGAEAPVTRFETARGYRLTVTPNHRITVVAAGENRDWIPIAVKDIPKGALFPLKIGGLLGKPMQVQLQPLEPLYRTSAQVVAPSSITAELAELIGWFMANGSLHKRNIRFTVDQHDPDVADYICEMGLRLFGLRGHVSQDPGCVCIEFNSVRLVRWWQRNGLAKIRPEGHRGKGYTTHVPDCILSTNDPAVYAAFIRGVSELDGSVESGIPTITSACRQFVGDLQSMLLTLGMPYRLKENIGGKSGRPVYKLLLGSISFCKHWVDTIGFRGDRKRCKLQVNHVQSGKYDIIPVPKALIEKLLPIGSDDRKYALISWHRCGGLSRDFAKRLLEKTGCEKLRHLLGFFYDTIKSLEMIAAAPTFDLAVGGGTYVANGFIVQGYSHTPVTAVYVPVITIREFVLKPVFTFHPIRYPEPWCTLPKSVGVSVVGPLGMVTIGGDTYRIKPSLRTPFSK